tara:strand:+ start:2128 stop:2241 length:114 start_codon:yes stop_codon:yes gene_type:complete
MEGDVNTISTADAKSIKQQAISSILSASCFVFPLFIT